MIPSARVGCGVVWKHLLHAFSPCLDAAEQWEQRDMIMHFLYVWLYYITCVVC